MVKRIAKRMDWYRSFPRDFQTSLNYRLMTPAQRGAYRDLLDACWINFPNVRFPMDEAKIREVCNIRTHQDWDAIMPTVLARFDIHDGYLHNARLIEELDDALTVTENSKIKLDSRKDREKPFSKEPNVLASGTVVSTRVSSGVDTPIGTRDVTITEQNITEHNRTEQGPGDLLSTMTQENEKTEVMRHGQPGYFRRGQYPGTSPKAIFSWMAKAWARLKGEAAYLRYPSKFPEAWEQLCDQKSADLLVPAFELWIIKHALHERIDWPLQDFMRVAEEFMAQVIPLNETKPRITVEQLAATELNALKAWCIQNPSQHAEVIDGKIVCHPDKEAELDPDELFGPEVTE